VASAVTDRVAVEGLVSGGLGIGAGRGLKRIAALGPLLLGVAALGPLLLVRAGSVANVAAVFYSVWIVVRPMHQAAKIIPLV